MLGLDVQEKGGSKEKKNGINDGRLQHDSDMLKSKIIRNHVTPTTASMYFPDKTSEMEAVWSVYVRAKLESLIPKLAHLYIRYRMECGFLEGRVLTPMPQAQIKE